MDFNSDGSRLAVGYGDRGGTVALVDANTGQVLVSEMKHKRGLEAIQFVDGDKKLATVSLDMNFRLFDVESGKQLEKSNVRMRPTAAQFDAVNDAGYEVVINLALGTTPRDLANEPQILADHGM